MNEALHGIHNLAQRHHVVEAENGDMLAISKNHTTAEGAKANEFAASLRKTGRDVRVRFMDTGVPYRLVGINTELEHGITDDHHPNSNARRMRERAVELAKATVSMGIPDTSPSDTSLTENPKVWMG